MMAASISILILIVVGACAANEVPKMFGRCKPLSETHMENFRKCSDELRLPDILYNSYDMRVNLCLCVSKKEKFISEDERQFHYEFFLKTLKNSKNSEAIKKGIEKAINYCTTIYHKNTEGKRIMKCLHDKLLFVCLSKAD